MDHAHLSPASPSRAQSAVDIICFVIVGAGLLALGSLVPDEGLVSRVAVPLRTLLFLGLLTWLLLRAGQTWRAQGLRRPASLKRAAILIVAGYLSIASIGALLIGWVLPSLGWSGQASGAFAHLHGNAGEYLYWLIVAWACAALGEELAFRGFLLPRIESLLGGPGAVVTAAALVLQALLFGFSHLYQGPGGVLVTAVTGLMLGAAYLASGRNLIVCILLHGLVDTISLTVLFLGVPI